jgi:3,4-dihydroxy 2-butanone 4-phosphate synthase/GTP cyclohydrolase II
MRLAGLRPAAVICKILDDDGMEARMPQLEKFVLQHGMLMTTVADIISFRLRTENFTERGAETELLTPYGEFKAVCFTNKLDKVTHLALIKGELSPDKEIMVRVHRECLTGDVFFSRHCKCSKQLRRAMRMISEEGLGIILYLRNAGDPPCLCSRSTHFKYGNKGIDTYQVNDISTEYISLIDYGVGAQMLVKLGVRKVRALTDNPRKIVGVKGYNLDIVEALPLK